MNHGDGRGTGAAFAPGVLRLTAATNAREDVMSKVVSTCTAFAIAATLLSAPTYAQSPADFYRGKTLRMLIGYGPGGGYDLYGRLVAEFLPKHIPGNPTMV